MMQRVMLLPNVSGQSHHIPAKRHTTVHAAKLYIFHDNNFCTTKYLKIHQICSPHITQFPHLYPLNMVLWKPFFMLPAAYQSHHHYMDSAHYAQTQSYFFLSVVLRRRSHICIFPRSIKAPTTIAIRPTTTKTSAFAMRIMHEFVRNHYNILCQ